MKNTIKLLSLLLIFACKVYAEKQPNLLFIFPDQMRGSAMGFVGKENVITPNLDAFAKESAVFTEAISNYPLCSPARAMLMSGLHPIQTKVTSNCTDKTEPFGCELPADANCWSDILKKKGYSLGYIGKWHLDSPREPYIKCQNNTPEIKWNDWCPPSRRHGFDFWLAYGTYDMHLKPMYWETDAGRQEFFYADKWGPEYEADNAIAYLKNENGKYRDNKKPFALTVSINPPHGPYNQVPDRYKELYKDTDLESLVLPTVPAKGERWGDYYRKNIKDYYACITGVDEQFGRIMQALKDEGLYENTLVVFTADHGNCLGAHNNKAKGVYYEESINIPFMMRFPNKIKPRQDNALISLADFLPTTLGLMGYEKDIPKDVIGLNLTEYLKTGTGEKPTNQWYFTSSPGKVESGRRGIRDSRYTYVLNKNGKGKLTEILLDREKDPNQFINFADKEPEIAKEFKAELKTWLIKTNDPFIKHF
jgi:arylsulfatase A-like enzyme